jgi:hypothetical protein
MTKKIQKSSSFNSSSKVNSMDKIITKELDSEIKKLELAKRQFNNFYLSEKKKLITRFAHRIMVSSSGELASQLQKLHQMESEEEEKKKKKDLSLPPILPLLSTKLFDESSIDSFSSTYMVDSIHSRINSPIIEEELVGEEDTDSFKKVKKNVMFNNEVKMNEIPSKDNTSDYLYTDILPPINVIVNKAINIQKQKLTINNEPKRLAPKSTKEFLDSLDEENSGFYICTNSKGKPLCDGYDNYIVKSNQITKKSDSEPTEPIVFTNPFESVSPMLLKRPTSEMSNPVTVSVSRSNSNSFSSSVKANITTNKSLNRTKLSHASFNETSSKTRNNSTILFKQVLNTKRKEEEEKICNLQLKAQNIRSLTLKPINIY